jgi:hypothetical protein
MYATRIRRAIEAHRSSVAIRNLKNHPKKESPKERK